MLIELAGLPGSGKSTVARALTGMPDTQNAGLRKLGRRDLVEHPMGVAHGFMRWRSLSLEWADKRAVFRILRRRISQDLVTGQGASLVVLEEGITQYIWRTLFLHPDVWTEPWDPFLDVGYPLIALEAGSAVLRARILGKGDGGPINQALGRQAAGSSGWTRAATLLERTLHQAERYRAVVRVDASGDLEATVDRVSEAIRLLDRDVA
jgi:hypothetical protein